MKRFMKRNAKRIVSAIITSALALTTVFSTGALNETKVAAATAAPTSTAPTSSLTLSKVAVPVAGVDNTWDITLSVSGQDKTTESYVVFVIDRSSSMDTHCVNPRHSYNEYGEHITDGGMFKYGTACQNVNFLAETKNAVNQAIDQLLPAGNVNNHVAVVSYGSKATASSSFYTNATSAKTSVNNIKIIDDGGYGESGAATNIQAGIKEAEKLLAGKSGLKTIVLLSDGEPTKAYKVTGISTEPSFFNITKYSCKNIGKRSEKHSIDAVLADSSKYVITAVDYNTVVGYGYDSEYSQHVDTAFYANCKHGVECVQNGFDITNAVVNATKYEADLAKTSGISIYSIGLGSISTVGKDVLKSASSDNTMYSATAANLSTVYANITGKIMYAASNATVTDPMGENFDLVVDGSVANSVTVSQGTVSYNAATETLSWSLGNVSNNIVATMTYRVTVDPELLPSLVDSDAVAYPTNKTTTINFVNNEGVAATQNFVVPNVRVAKYFTVTYDVDGNTASIVDNNNYRTSYDVTVTDATPSKDGYRFAGWKLVGDNSNSVYNAGAVVENINSNLVFTAQWVKLWTVSYVLDGSKLTDLTKTYDEGADVSAVITEAYVKDLVADQIPDSKIINTVSSTVSGDVEIAADIVVTITTVNKEYTVSYYVNGAYVGEEKVLYNENAEGIEYVSEELDFQGWGTLPTNVKEDEEVRINLNKKKFTVTYKVDGEIVGTETVKYGEDANGISYEVPVGYDFSGFGELPQNVTENKVVRATLSKKQFTVSFVDENGTVIKSETVAYLEAFQTTVDNPKKADVVTEGNKETQTAASWKKYSFKAWVPAGQYTLDDIQSVTQNMTFKASYTESSVKVKYYVLNPNLSQPSELSHYNKVNYSQGSEGTIYSWTEIANNNEAVAANLATIPTSFKKYNSSKLVELNEDQGITWYVIKKESDNWHVDGIITNQKYTLTVNYAVMDVDGNITPMDKESRTQTITATQEYTVVADAIEGYRFNNDETVKLNALSGIASYGNIEVTLVYQKLVTVTYQGLKNQDGTDREDVSFTDVEGNFLYTVKQQYSAGRYVVVITDDEGNVIERQTYSCQEQGYTNLNTGRTSWKVLEEDVLRVVEDTTFQPMYVLVKTETEKYTLTINYVYEDGSAVLNENGEAVVYTEQIANGTAYSVDSLELEGFTVDKATVEGTMPAKNVAETVVYTEIIVETEPEEEETTTVVEEEETTTVVEEEETTTVVEEEETTTVVEEEETTTVVEEEETTTVVEEEETTTVVDEEEGEVEGDEDVVEEEETTTVAEEEETTTVVDEEEGEVEADEDPIAGDSSTRTILLLVLTMISAMVTFVLFTKKRRESEEV